MEIIGYKSKYKAGQWGIVHYVIYDGCKYYSWEYDIGILSINNGRFEIYEQIDDEYIDIVIKETIPYIDMRKYSNIRKDNYNCMEIIYYILTKENMNNMPNTMISTMERTLIIAIFLVLYSIFIFGIGFLGGVSYSFTNLTVTEEEYLADPKSINFNL